MPYRQTIPSEWMAGPRLSRAAAPPPAPAAAADLHPVWQQAISRAEPPGQRDRVHDAPDQPPAFSYRTPPEVLARLPERTAALLRRLDRECTDARDRGVALGRHVDDASDRVGAALLDLRAAIQSAALPEVPDAATARTMVATQKWPAGFTEPMRARVVAIVAAAQRVDDARREHAELVDRRRQDAERTAPLIALRQRVAEAAARLRPPVRAIALHDIEPRRARTVLEQARSDITDLREQIASIEAAPLHPDDAEAEARRAVAQHAERGSAHRFVKLSNGRITVYEPHPTHHVEDHPPIPPLALLAAVMPEAMANWMLAAIPTAPDAPRLSERPAMLAEARQRMRTAELAERAALRAMGDPLDMFRPDADPLITLAVEAGR